MEEDTPRGKTFRKTYFDITDRSSFMANAERRRRNLPLTTVLSSSYSDRSRISKELRMASFPPTVIKVAIEWAFFGWPLRVLLYYECEAIPLEVSLPRQGMNTF